MDVRPLTFFVEIIIGDPVVKETPQNLATQRETDCHLILLCGFLKGQFTHINNKKVLFPLRLFINLDCFSLVLEIWKKVRGKI